MSRRSIFAVAGLAALVACSAESLKVDDGGKPETEGQEDEEEAEVPIPWGPQPAAARRLTDPRWRAAAEDLTGVAFTGGTDTAQILKYKFGTKQPERWELMLDYLRRSPSIRDVVVSGPDQHDGGVPSLAATAPSSPDERRAPREHLDRRAAHRGGHGEGLDRAVGRGCGGAVLLGRWIGAGL